MVMNGHSILQHIAVTVNIPVERWDLRIKMSRSRRGCMNEAAVSVFGAGHGRNLNDNTCAPYMYACGKSNLRHVGLFSANTAETLHSFTSQSGRKVVSVR